MTLAAHIALWLSAKAIKYGFGIIGGGNVVIWDAISRLAYTELICCHHEQAAAMAATYYARMKDSIGFCLVTTGAGSSNAITGVLAAHMDGVPLLVLSGNEASKYMNAPTRVWGVQGYPSCELAEKFTKYGARLSNEAAHTYLDDAYDVAMSAPQGPVWLDCPKDLQNAVVA